MSETSDTLHKMGDKITDMAPDVFKNEKGELGWQGVAGMLGATFAGLMALNWVKESFGFIGAIGAGLVGYLTFDYLSKEKNQNTATNTNTQQSANVQQTQNKISQTPLSQDPLAGATIAKEVKDVNVKYNPNQQDEFAGNISPTVIAQNTQHQNNVSINPTR